MMEKMAEYNWMSSNYVRLSLLIILMHHDFLSPLEICLINWLNGSLDKEWQEYVLVLILTS